MVILCILSTVLYVSLVAQHLLLIIMNSIQRGVFQRDNYLPDNTLVKENPLKTIDRSPCSATSKDLSPIDHILYISGRQIFHIPQSALTVSVLTEKCDKHLTPSQKQISIIFRTQCMHYCTLTLKILAVHPVINVQGTVI